MEFSELQIALIGAGVLAVVMVWAYNAWQDRKHRKAADDIFPQERDDALLGHGAPPAAEENPSAEMAEETAERLEPYFSEKIDQDQSPGDDESADNAVDEAAADAAVGDSLEPDSAALPRAMVPEACADAVADCLLRLVSAEPISATLIWGMQQSWSQELSKTLHWLAMDETGGTWRTIDSGESGHYREWIVALQLVDRRGPITESELLRFFDGMQQIAQETGAALELPSLGETLARTSALDEFCAAADIQFVLHVVEASGGIFAGTKLRGVAEAAGLQLESDGVFRERDAVGGELFSVANIGAEPLDAESLRSMSIHGLTLSLDVPRVGDGGVALDHMLATATQLGDRLGGVLVDAQRAPLSDEMINAIRAKTGELQQRMRDGGIVPGSTRALRLFS